MELTQEKLHILRDSIEKTAYSTDAKVMATSILSPTLSGVAADEGKGLQTSAAGLAGSLIGKKIFKNNVLAKLLGAGAATAASHVGDGLVAPSEEVLKRMRREGKFSKWDYTKGIARGVATGTGFGLAAASGLGVLPALAAGVGGSLAGTAAGVGAGAGSLLAGGTLAGAGGATLGGALTGAAAGAARGAIGGAVVAPTLRYSIGKYHELKNERDLAKAKGQQPEQLSPEALEQAMRASESVPTDKALGALRDRIL